MKTKKLIYLAILLIAGFFEIFAQDTPNWLRYPALSPDGKTIAFCYKGDIYLVDSKGGIARPLTLSDGYDYMPIWSPDSKQIAFSSDRTGNFDIYLIPSQGGNSQRLTYNSAQDIPSCFSNDGKTVYFSSSRNKSFNTLQFPGGRIPEFYSVSTNGGNEKQELSLGIEDAKFNKEGSLMLYQDKKGYEDPFRKHHQSSIARDIWVYYTKGKSFKKLSTFDGEDRNPVWANTNDDYYYLSEKSGSFNIWKSNIKDNSKNVQITKFEKNPVRFLSISNDNQLCFGFEGQIYLTKENEQAKKVDIQILTDERYNPIKNEVFTNGATEMSVAPNGKEVVYVVRGDVFVTSLEGNTTKKITNTPTQERSVSFSPDGRSILYAAEKNNIWGIYETSLVRPEEKFFYNSTLLSEKVVVESKKESFQAKYSPDGSEVAFIENRTAIKVINLKSKEIREILPETKNYSYSDGDQWYDWSPDGKYIIFQYLEDNHWLTQIGLRESNGKGNIINLTQSGYDNSGAKWMMNGKSMLWFTTRDGMKNHGSHGWQSDVYGLFFSQSAYDKFKMSKEDFALLKDSEEKDKNVKKEDKKDEKKDDKKSEDKKEDKKVETVKIDWDDLMDRKVRLTINSSDLADALWSNDGEQLYYLTKFEKGYDLWVNKLRDKETKLLLKLNASSISSMQFDAEGKNIFLVADGRMLKISPDKPESKDIAFKAEMNIDYSAERAYMFEHAWRQANNKFYVSDMQGVDWKYYHDFYAKFLPYINNNRDFAELLSEMLGELNASHTGGRYSPRFSAGDETSFLGILEDNSYTGKGIKIAEIVDKSPFKKSDIKTKAGFIIEKIDGTEINENNPIAKLLNRKTGITTLVSLFDPKTNSRWDEIIKPISFGEFNELLYQRWVKNMQAQTEKLSNGKIGYVHVRGMDNGSFRVVYEQALGKYPNAEALIVDTRYNGGGWLHDDLATFLSGKKYIEFVPRERKIGDEPVGKWNKPSAVIMCEGNYSDAHMFPYTYKALGIGKLIGAPVPGTGTAVWWETMQDPTMVFGIPQVGIKGNDGKYLENQQLEPDIKVLNDPETILSGRDKQLETTVEELLKEVGIKK